MGFLSGVGSMLNNLTGATSAGAQSQRYAIASAQLNNQYQKEFAQNAHQWEVEDLEKAGLNPILSAGGSGASASGGGVASATEQSAGLNIMDVLGAGVNAYTGVQNAKQINANTKKTDAETLLTDLKAQRELLEIGIRTNMAPHELEQIKENIRLTQQKLKLLTTGAAGSFFGTETGEKIKEGWEYNAENIGEILETLAKTFPGMSNINEIKKKLNELKDKK